MSAMNWCAMVCLSRWECSFTPTIAEYLSHIARIPQSVNHHRAILAVTTDFWDAYLRDDAAARKWLDGEEVRGVLETNDRWQRK